MQMSFIAEVACRLIGATLIGAGVGLDRELRHKPAGLKTHALVGLGASLITVVCAYLPDPAGMTRAIQGIIAGVGFLGGGAILKSTDESISGLTTAASIWVVASLGIACGAGQWVMAIIALAIALIVLIAGNAIEKFFRGR
jgi:putative Mg2+ transporter-C (MgtC) family protein